MVSVWKHACIALLIAAPSHAERVGVASCFKQAVASVVKRFEEIVPFEVSVSGKTYSVNWEIGDATAMVYLTGDRSTVIKLYSSYEEAAARFEYWATRFLREEKGIPMPEILHKVQLIPDPRPGNSGKKSRSSLRNM